MKDGKHPNPNTIHPIAGYDKEIYVKPTITNPNIIVGDFTYIADSDFESHVSHLYEWNDDKLIIGKFCQIAAGISICFGRRRNGEIDADILPCFLKKRQSTVVRKIRTTAADGKTYAVNHYNLDMIISLGYRIKSSIATQFRRWATERLKEYMIKGFAMDDERLKNLGGGSYWKELLDRIRDIRSSEEGGKRGQKRKVQQTLEFTGLFGG